MKRSLWFLMAIGFIVAQSSYMLAWSAYTAFVKGQKPMFTYQNTQVSTINNFQEEDVDYVEYLNA